MSTDSSIEDPDQLARITAIVTEQVLKALDARRKRPDQAPELEAAADLPQRPRTLQASAVPTARKKKTIKKKSKDSPDDSVSSSELSSKPSTSEEDSSSSESDSSSSSSASEQEKKKKKKRQSRAPDDKSFFKNFITIVNQMEDSDYFIPPRYLRMEHKPQLFSPSMEARQSTTPFTSPLVRYLYESIFSVGFYSNTLVTASAAALEAGIPAKQVAAFLRTGWKPIHDMAADAALMADIQTDPSVSKSTAKAALLLRTSVPAIAATTPLAQQMAKLQRKAGEAAVRAAAKEAQQPKREFQPQQHRKAQQQHKQPQKTKNTYGRSRMPFGSTGAGTAKDATAPKDD